MAEFFKSGKVWLTFLLAMLVTTAANFARSEDYSSGTWRYKMTVTVETPEGIKIGSAVREVTVKRKANLIREMAGVDVKVRGEAVTVDLGKRGILFATMEDNIGPDYAYQVVFDAFPFNGSLTDEGISYYSHLKNVKSVLNPEQYPTMVMFSDLANPRSVQPVWRGEFFNEKIGRGAKRAFRVKEDNFDKAYGAGVKLKEVSIEITNEPITVGLIKYLNWLPNYYDKMFDGLQFNTIKSKYPFANSLSSGAFSTEVPSHG